MYALSLRRADHTRQYSIRQTASSGWEVRLVEDLIVRRLSHYWDWHRVERALAIFEREAAELTESGWQIAPPDVSR